MSFPDSETLKKMRKKLEEVEPTRLLPKDASKAQVLKYRICEKFVIHLLDNNLSQAQLARDLKMDTARLNEIIKYQIDLFTVDKLLDFLERLDPSIEVKVA